MRLLAPIGILLLLAMTAQAAPRLGEISGDQVRVRSGPATRHGILETLDRGDLVIVVGEEGDWKRVAIPGGYPCWVHASLVRRDAEGGGVATGDRVLLRPSAGKDLLPLEHRLSRGDPLTVLGAQGEWLRVIAPPEAYAYVYSDFVRDLGPADEYRRLIAKAAATRREALLAGRSVKELEAEKEARQRRLREEVLALGAQVLAEQGEAEDLVARLRPLALNATDELVRAYVVSLIALLGQRRDVEALRRSVVEADRDAREDREALRAALEEAEGRYAEALREARRAEEREERTMTAVGVLTARGGAFVLVEKGRDLALLTSTRFRLGDFAGKRVGVFGKVLGSEGVRGVTLLLVEKLEIVSAENEGR